jgi:ABC-type Zn uptake system ZnuABC Zn-binding protein ZnuA
MKKELGLESIEFSPCELLPQDDRKAGKDYLSVMKQNLANLGAILK